MTRPPVKWKDHVHTFGARERIPSLPCGLDLLPGFLSRALGATTAHVIDRVPTIPEQTRGIVNVRRRDDAA